jgi:transcriptional regulator with GAF, ATPase, and Fis domain
MVRLCQYSWPGNIRELENVIERAVILSSGTELDSVPDLAASAPIALPAPEPSSSRASSGDASEALALEDIERRHIVAMLRKSGWRIEGPSGAARLLDMNASTLRSRIKRLGIERSRDAAPSISSTS